jgi:cytochrome c biogenesis protein CcmG, thiol:disulfide interchange protein DsbE
MMLKKFTLIAFLFVLCFSSLTIADDFKLKLRSTDGKMVDLAELNKEGPLLISFWATYCEPCKKEIPHLFDLRKEFEKQNLQLVLISVDSPRSQKRVKPFVSGKKWDCPVLLDTNGKEMKKLKGANPPYTMLVDKDGKIVYTHSGYRPGDEKHLGEEIKKMTGITESQE